MTWVLVNRAGYIREWERPFITRRNQIELLIMKIIWPLLDWVTQQVWLVENLNFNILISFFLLPFKTTFAAFWRFRKSKNLLKSYLELIFFQDIFRNWNNSQLQQFLNVRKSKLRYLVENKLAFPGQIYKMGVI